MSSVLYENELNKPVRSRRSREPGSPVDEAPVLFQLPDLTLPRPRPPFRPESEAAALAPVPPKSLPAAAEALAASAGNVAEDKERMHRAEGSREGHRRRRRSRPAPEPTPATWQATTTRIVLGASLVGLFFIAWAILSGNGNDEESFSTADPWVVQSAPQHDSLLVDTIDYNQNGENADSAAWPPAETLPAGVEFVQPANNKPLVPPLAGGETKLTSGPQAELASESEAAKYGFPAALPQESPAIDNTEAWIEETRRLTEDRRRAELESTAAPQQGPPSSDQYLQVDLRSGYSQAAGLSNQSAPAGYDSTSPLPPGGGAYSYPEVDRQQGPAYRTADRSQQYDNSSRFEPYQGESAGYTGDPGRDAPLQQIRPRHERIGSGIH